MSISCIPREVQQIVFRYLPFTEQLEDMLVCKDWAALLEDLLNRTFWKPNFEKFGLRDSTRIQFYENEEIKSMMLAHFQKYKKLPNLIINLIDENENPADKDHQLASLIGCPSISLLKFRNMLPFERMLLLMRGLRKDCTKFFAYLTTIHRKSYSSILRENNAAQRGHAKAIIHQLSQESPYLHLLLSQVQQPLGPYDAAQVMSAVCPLILSCHYNEGMVRDICAVIIKSRYNITDFLNRRIVLQPEGQLHASGTDFVKEVLKPEIERFNLDVTDDDWRACGLKLPLPQ